MPEGSNMGGNRGPDTAGWTPGPWQGVFSKHPDIATQRWWEVTDNDGSIICEVFHDEREEEPFITYAIQEANAHLIAAAPELYGALEEVSRRLAAIAPNRAGDAQNKEAGIKLAERILAKARGETA